MLDFVHTLLDEFRQKRQGADRLVTQFKSQSHQVTQRMAQVNAEQQAQQAQQQVLDPLQQMQQATYIPTTIPTTIPADQMMMVHPMFYSYGWAGQEIASFYGL